MRFWPCRRDDRPSPGVVSARTRTPRRRMPAGLLVTGEPAAARAGASRPGSLSMIPAQRSRPGRTGGRPRRYRDGRENAGVCAALRGGKPGRRTDWWPTGRPPPTVLVVAGVEPLAGGPVRRAAGRQNAAGATAGTKCGRRQRFGSLGSSRSAARTRPCGFPPGIPQPCAITANLRDHGKSRRRSARLPGPVRFAWRRRGGLRQDSLTNGCPARIPDASHHAPPPAAPPDAVAAKLRDEGLPDQGRRIGGCGPSRGRRGAMRLGGGMVGRGRRQGSPRGRGRAVGGGPWKTDKTLCNSLPPGHDPVVARCGRAGGMLDRPALTGIAGAGMVGQRGEP